MNSPARTGPILVWLRDDLRLADQPALHEAAARGGDVLCVYVLERDTPEVRPLGGASLWWLHHSLAALGASLKAIGGRLDLLEGRPEDLIPALACACDARAVLWTRRYDPGQVAVDGRIKDSLKLQGHAPESFNGQLLHEPWTLKTKTGGFFRVYSPFWRAAQALPPQASPLPAPKVLTVAKWPARGPRTVTLADLHLLPSKPDWAGGLGECWTPGEAGARERLAGFLDGGIRGYAANRDRPDLPATSALSPHLRFGEITPRQILHAVEHANAASPGIAKDADKFMSEVGWREFAYHLLFHAPSLATVNFQERFNHFPWRDGSETELEAWRRGRTGYPIVDAGMRELWITGTMHNRVRMICASFLVKDLMVDWRVGEAWFWDTLCDADVANNPASWQWVAGSGADAAPYFRIFNPVLQAMKFDPGGSYVRKYVPELANLPDNWIHRPWEAPLAVLKAAGVELQRDYPSPIVDHGLARDRALAAFAVLKGVAA